MSELIAQATSPRGEVTLVRHADGRLELRVNGVFVMDDRETSTERRLASAALGQHPGQGLRLCLGGLGLGFTADEALRDPRVTSLDIVELEPSVVAWHRDGTLGTSTRVLSDARARVVNADIHDHIRSASDGAYDLVLLDVDNGPSSLVHEANARVYSADFARECRRVLAKAGSLVVWSASPEPRLRERLAATFGACESEALPVRLGHRDETYHLLTARAGQA